MFYLRCCFNICIYKLLYYVETNSKFGPNTSDNNLTPVVFTIYLKFMMQVVLVAQNSPIFIFIIHVRIYVKGLWSGQHSLSIVTADS